MNAGHTYLDYLHDIYEAARKAVAFSHGLSVEIFVADEKSVFAVVRALEIVGEATKKVPAAVRSRYPEIPWRTMAGMRDKLIHDYFGIDAAVVWQTVQDDLPTLLRALEVVLEAEEPGHAP